MKKYIIANFTRSYDEGHSSQNLTHLLASIFITDKLLLDNLINWDIDQNECYVFKFRLGSEDLKPVVNSLNGVIIIEMTINYFFNFYKGLYKDSDTNKNSYFIFINTLIGSVTTQKKDLPIEFFKVLFIFENFDWVTVYLIFRFFRIKISGGSITKRIILNTTNFVLSNYLLKMNYTLQDIYDSYKYFFTYFSTKKTKVDYSRIDLELNSLLLKEIISNEIWVTKEIVNKDLSFKEKSLLQTKSELTVLDRDKSNLISQKKSHNKDINNSKKYFRLNKREELLKKIIIDKELSIKDLNAKINKYDTEIKNLEYLNNKELLEKYFKEFHNIQRERNITEVGNFITKSKTLVKAKESKRYYSTRIEPSILDLNNFSLDRDPELNKNRTNTNLNNLENIINNSEVPKININLSIENKNIKKLNFYLDSPIYLELQRILTNSNLDEDTQLKIEQFLHNQGVLFLKNRINQTLDINYYKLNPYVLDSLKKSIIELEKLIENYKTNINSIKKKDNTEYVESLIILELNNDEIISQLLGRLIRIISNNSLTNKNSCTELACDLGQSLLYQFYANNYKKSNHLKKEYGLSQFVDDNYKKLSELANDTVLIQIGIKLLNFLEEVKLIHSELKIIDKNHKNHIYVCNDIILEKISKFIDLYNLSYKIPMIVKPKEYSRDLKTHKEKLGGYLLNDKEIIIPVIIKNNELKDQAVIKEHNIIFNLVNNLSSVGYKINIPVLDFILENGVKYELFTDPNFIHPLEIKKKEKKLTKMEKTKLESFISRKQLEMNILGLALIFKNVPEFFIPVRIDNRGRVYCMVDYLNYQGIELAKALLLFSNSEKILKCDIDSIKYLKIFGANCYGNGLEKKSYFDRVEWINKNEEDILNFRNGKLIKKANSKLLFIAFCFEYINYYNSLSNDDKFYLSHFPIQLDATCNGYQHLSLLSGDEQLAGELNLIPSQKIEPKDFYNFVALKLNDYLEKSLIEIQNKVKETQLKGEELQKELEIIESYKRLIKLEINRKLIKLPIMVKPYNATLYQMVNYIKEQFEIVYIKEIELNESNLFNEIYDFNTNNYKNKQKNKVCYIDKNKKTTLTNNDLFLFCKLIEKIIYNEFPKLEELNKYLKKIAEICCKLNITITWALPSGLNVNQFYVDSEAIRLKPFKFRKNTLSLQIKTKNINKAKQIRALMPNLIHSLDAASLALMVDMFFINNESKQSNFNFFAIHDCFATTSNNISNLINYIKLVYIKIYSDDSYLKKFDQGIIDSIKLHFGNEAFNDETKKIKVNGFGLDYPNVDDIIKGKIKAYKIFNSDFILN